MIEKTVSEGNAVQRHIPYVQEVITPVSDIHPYIVTHHNPGSMASEQFRNVFARLQAFEKPPRCMVVASSVFQEGSTTSLLNLAVSITQNTHKKILLIDCNLYHPSLHLFLKMPLESGISEVVLRKIPVNTVIRATSIPGISLISSGSIPNHFAGIFSSQEFKDVLTQLNQQFDYVLIDAPPVWHYPDAGIIAQLTDGVILIIRSESTHRETTEMALMKLENLNVKTLGCILTQHKYHLPSFLYRFLQ